MITGDIVYLCEEEFVKFRNIHDWMKSSDNIYKTRVKSTSVENKFVFIASFVDHINESEAMISFQDEIIDSDIVCNCMIKAYELIVNNENYIHQNCSEIQEVITRRSITSKKDFIYFQSKVPNRKNSFIVKLSKLTLLSDIK